MKSLTLLRHAKTERESTSGLDFDRRLNERGVKDATRIGEEIRSQGLDYDSILCSPAKRAAETAKFAGLSPRFDDRIYDASAGQLLRIAQERDRGVDRLLMIGHNPGFEQLASRLIGSPMDMPTGSLAEIELPIEDWTDTGTGRGVLRRFVRPKELR
ncbi:MAG TPA: histidine phosphatase family protein [Sphingomicrobium sp.]|nr:histidine phosphatase family protein [Sphingomicrobium sp.]